MKSNKWQVLTAIRAMKEIALLREESLERDVMDRTEVAQMKAEMMRLRQLASQLAPGALKQALSKRATELGKKISPYVNRGSA